MFMKKMPRRASYKSSLFVLFGGANDIFFNATLPARHSLQVLSSLMAELQDRGAENILLPSYTDLSQIPYDEYTTPLNRRQLQAFSMHFSKGIKTLASGAGEGVKAVDLLPLFEEFTYYRQPHKYGIGPLGAYGSCLTGAYEETDKRSLCRDPDSRVFW